ncbi:hypothetical protein [Clostridium ihumii]|uniref:hypothetical protein n=1 Tax=Clostridium ihumii TaxID=1470356 RepID=UPI00058BC9D0|nr:hypothetical protein [Clostridium ihumii]
MKKNLKIFYMIFIIILFIMLIFTLFVDKYHDLMMPIVLMMISISNLLNIKTNKECNEVLKNTTLVWYISLVIGIFLFSYCIFDIFFI